MSLAAAEERWSAREKTTGSASLGGEREDREVLAGVSSIISGCGDPLPRCFFLTGPWGEESRWAWEAVAL